VIKKKSPKARLKVMIVVGARPNFMKAAPLLREMSKSPLFDVQLVHTGQHYDIQMSEVFFKDLGLPTPHISLGIGSGTQAVQTAKIMMAIEGPLDSTEEKPDLLIVVGDVNSTLAATLTAKKLHIPVAHVEAGLRSFDETMPEEINRVLTDHISDLLFTTEEAANTNLRNEGVSPHKIHFVGNVMIDSLLTNMDQIDKSTILDTLGVKEKEYGVVTMHRPSNVDKKESFIKIFSALEKIQQTLPLIFPAHPRTKKQMESFGLGERLQNATNFKIIDPLGYTDFMKAVKHAKIVLTDSGGIQEETTMLGVPCITMRMNTERPVTVDLGTNVVTGDNPEKIIEEVQKIFSGNSKKTTTPQRWDGKTAERIVNVITQSFYE
jgi:UDP-N-acetylglucosamine 2-epimerase (non-hydrolysing)